MAYANWVRKTLRTSLVTTGTEEQDSARLIPEVVNEVYVVVTKTAEFNPDNLLTVRLQCQVGGTWFDVSWDSATHSVLPATAVDIATDVTRTPNIVNVDNIIPPYSVVAYYKELPSNKLRTVSVSSGTGVINTFGVESYFQLNHQ